MIHSNPKNRSDVKSTEEWMKVLWLQEATRADLVHDWQYEPETFELFAPVKYTEMKQLKTKVKIVEKTLHRGASYTPDFKVTLTRKGMKVFEEAMSISLKMAEFNTFYTDIKGAFNPNDQPRYFSIIQKAMYHVHGIWVARVVPFHKVKGRPKGLFAATFAPEPVRWKQNGKELNAMGRSCMGIDEFIKSKLGE